MAARRCARTYTILAGGGVRITWACGSLKVVAGETAVDLDLLADHLEVALSERGGCTTPWPA